MNENIDLTKILKDCPVGTKLYSSIHGEVEFTRISNDNVYPIETMDCTLCSCSFTKNGKHFREYKDSECVLFPSKYQREWSKFKVDLPINTPVMTSDDRIIWTLGYYAGDNKIWEIGTTSQEPYRKSRFKYIIPYKKFNPNNIKESLKHNIVNN